MKDFKDIMVELGMFEENRFNVSDRVYTFENGSIIQFINTDDPQKLRGLKSDIAFFDEANEIDEDSAFQISIRTSGKILYAYNPTISPYHYLRKMEDCDRFVTTYQDNVFLPDDMVKAIENLKHTNEKKWKIYGLGEYVANDKAIYKFDIVDDVPKDERGNPNVDMVGFGLDWGYNDPTAMVAVYRNGQDLYIEEIIYDTNLVMKDIANKLNKLGIDKSYEIWCDSSEPRSIEELYRMGFNTKAVTKGPDSIKFGISVLQNYNIKVLKKSQNLINEIYGYQYSSDKNGYVTEIPESGLDHLMDAMRYVGMMKLSQKAQAKGRYAITIGKIKY